MILVPDARSDIDQLFQFSDILTAPRLNHTPFLVLVELDGVTTIDIVPSADRVLSYPDDATVLAQWRGQWRSDWFVMTVADVRQAKAERGS